MTNINDWLLANPVGAEPDDEDETPTLESTVLSAPDVSPDDAAAQRRTAEAAGVSPALGNSPLTARAADARRLRDISNENPRLAEWLARPDNYVVARDDVENLTLFERGWRSLVRGAFGRASRYKAYGVQSDYAAALSIPTDPIGAFTYSGARILSSAATGDLLGNEQGRQGELDVEYGRLAYRAQQEARGWDALSVEDRARLEELATREGQEDWGPFILGPTRRLLPQMVGSFERGVDQAAARADEVWENPFPGMALVPAGPNGGMRLVTTPSERSDARRVLEGGVAAVAQAPGAAVATVGGAGGGYLSFGYEMETGIAYDQMIRQGIAPDIAAERAEQYGAWATAIEFVGETLGIKLSGTGRLATRGILSERVLSAPGSSATGRAMGSLLGTAADQGVEEAAQEYAQIIHQDLARQDQENPGGESRVRWAEVLTPEAIQQILMAGYIGAQGGAGMAVVPAGANFALDTAAAQRAERNARVFEEMTRAAQESLVAQRLPSAFESAVSAATGDSSVFIDADRFVEHFQSAGVSPYAVADELGVGQERLTQALASHGQVEIPTGVFAARVLRIPAHSTLASHARISPTDATPAEIESANEVFRAEVERIAQESDAVAADNDMGAFVEGKLRDLFAAAEQEGGYRPEVARRYAQMAASLPRAMVARARAIDPAYADKLESDFRTLFAERFDIAGPGRDGGFEGASVLPQGSPEQAQRHFDYLNDILEERRSLSTPGMRRDAPEQIPEVGTREYAEAVLNAREAQARGDKLAPIQRSLLKWEADNAFPEGLFQDQQSQQAVAPWLAERFSQEEIDSWLVLINDPNATPDQILNHPIQTALEAEAGPPTFTKETIAQEGALASRVYRIDGQEFDAPGYIVHMRAKFEAEVGAPLLQDRVAVIVTGQPGAGKSTTRAGLASMFGAISIDLDEMRAGIPEYEDGKGSSRTTQVEAGELRRILLDQVLAEGQNALVEMVGKSQADILGTAAHLQENGYTVALANVSVSYDNSVRRYAKRTISGGRWVHADFIRVVADEPSAIFGELVAEGSLSGYIQVDGNGPQGSEKVTSAQGSIHGPALEAAIRSNRNRPGREPDRLDPARADAGSLDGQSGESGLAREAAQAGARGSIRYENFRAGEFGSAMIRMGKASDLSTFLHEFGHLGHLVLESVATDPKAPAEFRAMWDNTLQWWGVSQEQWNEISALHITPLAQISESDQRRINTLIRAQFERDATPSEIEMVFAGEQRHKRRSPFFEQWARTFEAYLMEGKAPSLTLREAFAAFAAWLKDIYKKIFRLDHNLNPQIRDVFDRLLATDQEMAEARAAMGSDFSLPLEMFSEAERALIIEARDAQDAELRARVFDSVMRKEKRWFRAERSRVRPTAVLELYDTNHPDPEKARDARARRALEWIAFTEWDALTGEVSEEEATLSSDGFAMPEGLPEMRLDMSTLDEADRAGLPEGLQPLASAEDAQAALDNAMALKRQSRTRQPQRLWAFIKSGVMVNGVLRRGIKDEGGEVIQALGSARARPGLINNESGLTADEWGERAWEAGYFGAVPRQNQLNQFAGWRAATANMDTLQLAKEMERAGKDRGFIWQHSGWARGLDGEWRFEIPSEDLRVIRPLNQVARRKTAITVAEVIDWPSLFAAYPHLENIEIEFTSDKTEGGSYWHRDGGNAVIFITRGHNSAALLSVLRHELQHAIQRFEGFADGYNPDSVTRGSARWKKAVQVRLSHSEEWRKHKRGTAEPTADDIREAEAGAAFAVYANEMGEIEARDVQNRARSQWSGRRGDYRSWPMSPEERAAVPPNDAFDIYRDPELTWRAPRSRADSAVPRQTLQQDEVPDAGSFEAGLHLRQDDAGNWFVADRTGERQSEHIFGDEIGARAALSNMRSGLPEMGEIRMLPDGDFGGRAPTQLLPDGGAAGGGNFGETPFFRGAVHEADPSQGPNNAVFFTPSREFAGEFPRAVPAEQRQVSEFRLREDRIADMRNPETQQRVLAELASDPDATAHLQRRIGQMRDKATGHVDWVISADPAIRDAIERAGYQGVWLDEGGGNASVAVFDRNAIHRAPDAPNAGDGGSGSFEMFQSGTPLIYHGSAKPLNGIRPILFATPHQPTAAFFARLDRKETRGMRRVTPLLPRFDNPMEVQANGALITAMGTDRELWRLVEQAQANGNDAIIVHNVVDGPAMDIRSVYAEPIDVYIILDPKKVEKLPADYIDAGPMVQSLLRMFGSFQLFQGDAAIDVIRARVNNAPADVPRNDIPLDQVRVAYPKADAARMSARLADQDGELTTSWGATLQVRAGLDMVVGEAQGEGRPVRKDIFDQTYQEVAGGEFAKRSDVPVGFVTLAAPQTINTLEGPVPAEAGDIVLIGAIGEMWPIRADKFAQRYDVAAQAPMFGDSVGESNAALDTQGRRPTPRELLDALIDDIRNVRQVYSSKDEAAAAAYQNRADALRWFEARGIDLSGSKEDIRAQIKEALQREQEEAGGGWHPDDIAPWFGFSSGDELVQALKGLKPRAVAIEENIDARLEAEYGDPLRDGTVAEAAALAGHIEAQSKRIEIELEAIQRATGGKRTPVGRAARSYAERSVQMMTVKQIKNHDTFLAGERRAARAAMEAAQKGDMQTALLHKQRQLVSFWLYRSARAASEHLDRIQTRWQRYSKSAGARNAIGPRHIEQIDAILDTIETGKASYRPNQTLDEWAADLATEGNDDLLVFNPEVVAEQIRRPFSQMDYADVQAIDDVLRNIETIGRGMIRLRKEKEAQRIADIQQGLRERIQQEWGKKLARRLSLVAPDAPTKAGLEFRHIHAQLLKMDYLARLLDGLKDGGPWMALMAQVQDAENDLHSRSQAASQQFLQIVRDHYTPAQFRQMLDKRIYIDAIEDNRTKAQLIGLALNMGNEYNREALLKGERWTPDQLQQVLSRLDTNDWRFVQSLWNYVAQWKEESFALDERTRGSRPQEVIATPFTLPDGTTLAGGYWPVAFSLDRSDQAAQRDARETVIGEYGGSFRQAATNRGRLKGRVGTGGQALSDDFMGVLAKHVHDSLRDITHRELIITLRKVKADKELRSMIARVAGRDAVRALDEWTHRLAARMPANAFGDYGRLPAYLRRAGTAHAMGFKVSVATLNLLGHLQAIPRNGVVAQMKQAGISVAVGFPDLLRRYLQGFATGEVATSSRVALVYEKSEMMRQRRNTFDRDIAEVKGDLVGRREGAVLPKQIEDTLQILNAYTDQVVSVPTWLAAYESARDGKVKGVSGEEEASVNYADSVVRMAISAGATKDLSALIASNNQWQRLFTMFMGWANTFYNQMATEQLPGVASGKISVPRFAANMVWIWLLPAVITMVFYGQDERRDDEDEFAYLMRMIGTGVVYPLQTIPLVRDLLSAIVQGYKPQTPISSVIDRSQKFASAVERGDQRQMVKQGFLLAGQLTGAPSQLYVTGDFAADVAAGEEELPWNSDDPADSLAEMLLRDTR